MFLLSCIILFLSLQYISCDCEGTTCPEDLCPDGKERRKVGTECCSCDKPQSGDPCGSNEACLPTQRCEVNDRSGNLECEDTCFDCNSLPGESLEFFNGCYNCSCDKTLLENTFPTYSIPLCFDPEDPYPINAVEHPCQAVPPDASSCVNRCDGAKVYAPDGCNVCVCSYQEPVNCTQVQCNCAAAQCQEDLCSDGKPRRQIGDDCCSCGAAVDECKGNAAEHACLEDTVKAERFTYDSDANECKAVQACAGGTNNFATKALCETQCVNTFAATPQPAGPSISEKSFAPPSVVASLLACVVALFVIFTL